MQADSKPACEAIEVVRQLPFLSFQVCWEHPRYCHFYVVWSTGRRHSEKIGMLTFVSCSCRITCTRVYCSSYSPVPLSLTCTGISATSCIPACAVMLADTAAPPACIPSQAPVIFCIISMTFSLLVSSLLGQEVGYAAIPSCFMTEKPRLSSVHNSMSSQGTTRQQGIDPG